MPNLSAGYRLAASRCPPAGLRFTNSEGDGLQVNVPGLDVQQANLQSIDIGTAKIGPISVGDLLISNTDFTLSAAHVLHVFRVYPGGHDQGVWTTHAATWLAAAVDHLARAS